MRAPPGMESAVAHRGKTGAKQAAQRDYKAILSTSDKADPQQDRDIGLCVKREKKRLCERSMAGHGRGCGCGCGCGCVGGGDDDVCVGGWRKLVARAPAGNGRMNATTLIPSLSVDSLGNC